MASENETAAEIIAEMRHKDKARRRFTLTDEYGGYETITIDRANTMLSLADRLEAALRRDKAAIEADALDVGGVVEATRERGDCAKLREALVRIVNERGILDFCHNNLGSKTWEDWDKVYKTLRKWIDEAMSALAAPARNCDIYATVEEARKVWCGTPSRDWDYLCDWLYATTKEMEVSDGSK